MSGSSLANEVDGIVALNRQLEAARKRQAKRSADYEKKIEDEVAAWKKFFKSCNSGLAGQLEKFGKLDASKQKGAIQQLRKTCSNYQANLAELKKTVGSDRVVVGNVTTYGIEDALSNVEGKLIAAEKAKGDAAMKVAAKDVAASGKLWSTKKAPVESKLDSTKAFVLKQTEPFPFPPLDKAIADYNKIVVGKDLSQLVSLSSSDDPKSKKMCTSIVDRLVDCCKAVVNSVGKYPEFAEPMSVADGLIDNQLKVLRKKFS